MLLWAGTPQILIHTSWSTSGEVILYSGRPVMLHIDCTAKTPREILRIQDSPQQASYIRTSRTGIRCERVNSLGVSHVWSCEHTCTHTLGRIHFSGKLGLRTGGPHTGVEGPSRCQEYPCRSRTSSSPPRQTREGLYYPQVCHERSRARGSEAAGRGPIPVGPWSPLTFQDTTHHRG